MPAKIALITYSLYTHVDQLGHKVEEGLKDAGAEVKRFRFAETLSDEVVAKMHGAPKPDYPVVTPDDLKEFDGFVFGFGTRYGRAPAQVSAFFDQTGGLWATGALVGKFASVFTSTAGQHGGQETTALTTVPFFVHHGINFVPIGYANANLSDLSELVGGSPYGAATIAAGDGSRQPTAKELDIAHYQGKYFAGVVNTFVAGKQKLAGASSSSAEPAATAAAAKDIPPPATAIAEDNTPQPYTVEESGADAAAKPTEEAAPKDTAAPVAAASNPTTAKQQAKKQKKKGLFALCCGKEEDLKN